MGSTMEGVMEASISEVAAKAGVSITTVSRAFAKPDMVSEKTRNRVFAAADELNYSISRSATSMKTGRSYRLALLLSEDISTWFNSRLLAGLNSVLHDEGYDISLYSVVTPEERHSFFAELPVRRNADAVIVSSFNVNPDEASRLQSVHIPIVGVNTPSLDGYDATVSIDDRSGMRMIVEHLITLGHERIALVRHRTSPSIPHSADLRIQGFDDVCREAGIVHPETIYYDETVDAPADDLLSQMLALPERPTAVCCVMDLMAIPLYFSMIRYGLRVPRDLSLTGFDDSTYAKESGLTTIRQDPAALGRVAAQKTLALIEGKTPERAHEIVMPRLVLRSSTAPLARED